MNSTPPMFHCLYFFQALKYYTEYKKYTLKHQWLKNNMKAETLSIPFWDFQICSREKNQGWFERVF
jgi:hypothetical protein